MPQSIRLIRNAIGERDGWKCHYCERPLSSGYNADPGAPDIPQLEHKIPESKGGTWELDNLVLACRHCNSFKHELTDTEFKHRLAWTWRYYEWCNPRQKKIIPPHWLADRIEHGR